MAVDPKSEKNETAQDLHRMARESAQQVWLAGMGAFAKAQQEGGKVFDNLVREGLDMQRKTQAAAEEHLSEAPTRASGLASGIGKRASGQWDKLEGIFEERVSKALRRLGVPTASDVQVLHDRIDALARELEEAKAQAASKRPAN
ncbi:MAG: poly(hydroxyalkanoate) granule-associated protein [Comamonadaceae bacterium]|nr:MAG: poly(hydroxyalkanoate) granule-associated protein [Comamonadaceae bacterium]